MIISTLFTKLSRGIFFPLTLIKMGFNKQARKEAKRQQEEALRLEREAFNKAQAQADDYNNSFDTRNASIIRINKEAQDFLDRYKKGEDISSLDPTANKYAQQTANQVTKTYKTANQLGSNAYSKGDSDYQAKLNSVASSNVAKGLASINEDALLNNVARKEDTSLQTSAMLNADRQAGMGATSNIFNLSSSMFNDTSSKRKLEEDIGAMKMNMLMSGIFGGLSGVANVASAGGFGAVFCVTEDAVITLEAGFVTANKVRANEKAKDFNGFSRITGITRASVDDILVISTSHFDLSCTPSHHFCRWDGDKDGVEASKLKIGDIVLTSEGEETITNIERKSGEFTVYNYRTKSGVYIANGFFSLS